MNDVICLSHQSSDVKISWPLIPRLQQYTLRQASIMCKLIISNLFANLFGTICNLFGIICNLFGIICNLFGISMPNTYISALNTLLQIKTFFHNMHELTHCVSLTPRSILSMTGFTEFRKPSDSASLVGLSPKSLSSTEVFELAVSSMTCRPHVTCDLNLAYSKQL